MVQIDNMKNLYSAIKDHEKEIIISSNLTLDSSLILPKDTSLSGAARKDGSYPALLFPENDGIGLTKNNTIKNLAIVTDPKHKAIFNAGIKSDLGSFILDHLELVGQLSFITRGSTKNSKIEINDLTIHSADSRHYPEQPQKYGVNVYQGALTIYNFNPDPASLIHVKATNVSIGQKNAPVIGSGIFIGGFGDLGGKVEISKLTTEDVYSTGKLPFGVADIITGAIFIVNGAHAKNIIQNGESATYGVNDMVLDNWGTVDDWLVKKAVTSYGPSGIGFVNFGTVKNFKITAPIETYGLGARGYNQYDGTLVDGAFDSISTYANGAIAVQISKKVGSLTFNGDLKTFGAVGNPLLKGVNVTLPAYGLSVKTGGSIEKLVVKGNIVTSGKKVTSLIVEKDGMIKDFDIQGKIIANGNKSEKIEDVSGSGISYHQAK
ncbi:hypothetical protein [Companilactobacillus versmoldensis]|uniref:Uncharacterized protein n=1 Tax=Companilactobacillus versmoldensis DSM 14857 = KCTC 3814 TaxID=1423815 RepID=A0A0R1SG12_9LACO|nr:hypothetical protein [Companilactobacillus versmoldensis]KRL68333.1 hypothetical protein FC27_GL000028 [Companilactobacillus versmoldensis DSM 14857 = KCTC 3814]